MKDYKKTFIGTVVTFVIGISCCWISSLAIWLGGIAFMGTIANLIESARSGLILVSCLLAVVSIYLYYRNRRKKPPENKLQNPHIP